MIARLTRLVYTYLRRYSGLLAGVVVLQTIATAMSLYLPTLNARIIDEGVIKGDTDYIWRTGAVMLGLAVVQAAAQIAAVWFGAKAAMAFGRDVRQAVFDRALAFSAQELQKFGAPSLITRNTNDVQQVQMLVLMTCIMLVSAPISMVGGVLMALREDPGLSWIILVAVIALGVSMSLIIVQMGPLFGAMQKRIDSINRVLREQIAGIRVIRAFVREQHESQRFDDVNEDLTHITVRVGRLMIAVFPLVIFVMNISNVGVLWFGAHRVESGDILIGQLTAFLAYLMQILISVMMTTMLLMMAPRSAVSANRILEVLETEPGIKTAAAPSVPKPVGHLEFKNVTFSYPGADDPALEGISFELLPGRTTALIGSTGSGKTTLINLIPRFFDVTSGSVLVDGVDVRDFDPEQLWNRLGLVPQRPYLFTGTVASNLRYGDPEASDEQLWEALRIAQAADFVEALDGGLDARIAQGGTNVSGGQRQRLSIARALVRSPKVLLFDDAFSALDVATDARLRAALAGNPNPPATLVVGQRVQTIRQADEILVLEHGRIVGRGSHEELLASCQTYQEIVESQLSVKEAA